MSRTTPIRLAVLSHDGTLLGYLTRRPSNGSWRALGALPRVTLNSHPKGFPSTRECVNQAVWLSEGVIAPMWTARLYEGEEPPPNLEPP